MGGGIFNVGTLVFRGGTVYENKPDNIADFSRRTVYGNESDNIVNATILCAAGDLGSLAASSCGTSQWMCSYVNCPSGTACPNCVADNMNA
jgi:hypothetical protein